MKKHIFGLAIFSFVVLTTAFVYGLFRYSEIAAVDVAQPIFQIERPYKTSSEGVELPIVTQAVFDVKTRKLEWEIIPPSTNNLPILHLFIKDEKGIRLLDSIRAINCLSGEKSLKFSQRYSKLSKITSQTSLYLIPDTTLYPAINATERQPMFDISKAIPVTIDYGK